MARLRSFGEWRLVYGAVVLLVLGLFLLSLGPVLSPFVLFLLLLLLLSPYAGNRPHTLVVTGSALLALFWLLETTGFLLAPFLLALVVAYIVDPIVDLLERRRVPRSAAIILLGLPAFALGVLGLVFGLPALINQILALIGRVPEALQRVAVWLANARLTILAWDLPLAREEAVLGWVESLDAERIGAFLEARRAQIAERGWQAVLGVGRGLGTLFAILGYAVLTPVVAYYVLRDYDGLTGQIRDLIPHRKRERWIAFATEYNLLLSRYLRGQLLAAATVGVLTGLGLWALGFPYAGLIGAIAGVFNVVPYLGLIVSIVPAALIALLSGSVVLSLAKVAAVFVVVQFVDSSILGPRIVGGSVGLHPVWVMLALAIGGFFLGLVGLLIAVPGAVLIKLLLHDALDRYRRSAVYTGRAPAEAP